MSIPGFLFLRTAPCLRVAFCCGSASETLCGSAAVFRPAAYRSFRALAEYSLPKREPFNTQRFSWSIKVTPTIRPVSLRRRWRSMWRAFRRSLSTFSVGASTNASATRWRVCSRWLSFLSSTYKCNFLGADNKQ